MGNTCAKFVVRRPDLLGDESAQQLVEADKRSLSSDSSLEDESAGKNGPALLRGSGELQRTESLENLLTCPICLDIIFEPVTSPCNHYFCKSCLRRLLQYQGPSTPCPKCRQPMNMREEALRVSRKLNKKVIAVFGGPSEERVRNIEQEDSEYQAARSSREQHERMLEENPLQVMFDTETDPARRSVLERDVNTLRAMGFSTVQSQKALFLWAGVYFEAVNWLVLMQGCDDLDVPWNMAQLQEQTLIRNSRRALLSLFAPIRNAPVVPGKLHVVLSSVALVGTAGSLCWCYCTAGLHALGHSEIIILLLKKEEETEPPQDVMDYLGHLYYKIAQGLALDDLSFTTFASSRSFLGDPLNSGFIFSRYCGQVVSGLPVPPAPFLFGVLLRGVEPQWAKLFPARLLLLMGRHHQSDFPFPLWSDRSRPPMVLAEHIKPMMHLACGLRIPGTSIVRTRTEHHGFIHIMLPQEAQQQVVQFLEHWPAARALTVHGGIARGVDCFLVHIPGRPCKALAFSTPSSQGNVLGAVQCVLVQHAASGGVVEGDRLVMGLEPAAFQHVLHCLKMARSCEIAASTHRGVQQLGLRLQWLPRAVIDSGVAHIMPADFPGRTVFHPLAIAAACMPRSSATATLPPFISRQLECLDLHPRISIVGVTVVTPRHLAAQRVDPSELDVYVVALVVAVNGLLAPHLRTCESGPSTMVLHVDIFPEQGVRYRITKDWTDAMPQAPDVSMPMWRSVLHRVVVPSVLTESINFHVTFQIA